MIWPNKERYLREWLERKGVKDPTPEQLRCAFLVDLWVDGLHHAPKTVRRCSDKGLELVVWNSLDTFDGDRLSMLVFLAHDLCVRVEIGPAMRALSVMLHARSKRDGSMFERHPTLSDAIERYRTRGYTINMETLNDGHQE